MTSPPPVAGRPLLTGWRVGLAWLVIGLTGLTLAYTGVSLWAGAGRGIELPGYLVGGSPSSWLYLLGQASALVLCVGSIGALARIRSLATAAVYAGFATAGLQLIDCVVGFVQRATLVIPVTALLYLAFAAGIDRELEADAKAQSRHP